MSSKVGQRWLSLACAPLILGGSAYVLDVADSSSAPARTAPAVAVGARPPAGRKSDFAWLQPARVPRGWPVARLAAGATLAYPPNWRPIESDAGSASAALLEHGQIRGYLNVTPQSGAETLANWARFRPAHNREEGDRKLVLDAAQTGLRFRSGTGSCVVDHYATVSAHYREIACIVRGARSTTVVVGAAPPRDWKLVYPELKRSIASFAT